MDKLVSVIIPTCKGGNKIIRAIESVLKQTYKKIEIIVVDDNGEGSLFQKSTENLIAPYLKLPNFRYFKHKECINGAAARNTGLELSLGEYIAFLDDDDFYLFDRIEECVRLLENNPENDAVYCDVAFIKNNSICGLKKVQHQGKLMRELLLDQSLIGTGSNIFLKRSVATEIGGFDTSFTRYQDIEFMLRFFKKHAVLPLQKIHVIKDISDSRFYPEYKNFRDVQNHFFENFDHIIKTMSLNDQHEIYFSKRMELLIAAYCSGNSEYIGEAKKLLSIRVRHLSLFERLKIYFNIFKMRNSSSVVFKLIKLLKGKIISSKLSQDIDKNTKANIENILNINSNLTV